MDREAKLWLGCVAAVLLTLAAGCGRGGGLTGPTEPVEATGGAPPAQRPAAMPPTLYGAFAAGADVPEAAANAGNMVLVVPSYAEDAHMVAAALRANGKVAVLSAHHVFGGPRSSWAAGWTQTQAWAAPLADLVVGVYVVDEPGLWGMPVADRDAAVSLVRSDGYRTIIAEGVDVAMRRDYRRPAVDLFGVTCYMWPGEGSWTMDRCEEAYRTHPEWNLVFAQGYDIHEGRPGSRVWNGDTASQVRRWAAIGRARAGVVFWVWRWPGQVGIGDDPELRAAFNREGGR